MFLISPQSVCYGYSLEEPWRGASNVYQYNLNAKVFICQPLLNVAMPGVHKLPDKAQCKLTVL